MSLKSPEEDEGKQDTADRQQATEGTWPTVDQVADIGLELAGIKKPIEDFAC